MKIRTAIPILLASASIMLSGIGLALAQPPRVRVTPQGQTPRRITPLQSPQGQGPAQGEEGGDTTPGQAGKLRPFRTGLEGRGQGRVSPAARIDFNLEDADLPDLVRVISRSTGKRFILPAKARAIKATIATGGEVTAAEAYRAFLSVLQINGMTVVPAGRYLKIVDTSGVEGQPLHIYRDGESTPLDDRFVTRMHRLQNVSSEDVAQLLGHFKSREGNITAYAPTNTLIITDTGANVRRMLSIISEIDIPRTGEQIWIEPIHYANASEIAARLQEIFPTGGSSGGGSAGGGAPARPRVRPAQNGRGSVAASAPGAAAGSEPATVGQRTGESRITNIIADERTNSLIILATERAYLRLLELIRYLDRPVEGDGSIHVHQLQYADADDMASTLNSLVGGTGGGGSKTSKAGGGRNNNSSSATLASAAAGGGGGDGLGSFEGSIRIQPHKGTNSLVITASLHDYASLRRVIDRLDRAPQQVFIEAIIMELGVDRTTDLGVAYHGGAPNVIEQDSLGLFGFEAGRTATPQLSPDLLTGLAVGIRGPNIPEAQQLVGFSIPAFGVVMNALTRTGDTNVLSTPHIIALNNTTAEITVGSNIPLQTSGLFGSGGASSLAGLAGGQLGQAAGAAGLAGLAGLAGGGLGGLGGAGGRRDVGTTIRVTPHVNDSGEIRLEIEEEISEAGTAQGTLGVVPISQRIAKTQVVVRDQQTVVIGGLMRDRSVTQEDKIPILGDIPLLGVLFRRQTTITQKTNLLLFLTPYIIRGPEDLRAIFERKMRERQEFIDRYFVFGDRDWIPPRDYSRTRGLVSEILNEIDEDNVERQLEAELQARPPPEHVPRPPIGAAEPFEGGEGEGVLIIGPDDGGDDGNPDAANINVGVSIPQQLRESNESEQE